MAFKLTKTELARRDEICKDLRTNLDKLSAVIDDPESTIGQKSEAASMFTVVMTEAEEFREEIASRFRDEYDDKSESWQESDRGSEIGEMIDEWENADLFCGLDINEPETDGLEDYIETLENLSTEV